MKGLKWNTIVKFAVLFMSLFVGFVVNSENTSAASISSIDNLSIQRQLSSSGSFQTESLGTRSLPTTLYTTSSTRYFALRNVQGTASISNPATGMYFSGEVTLGFYGWPGGYISETACSGVNGSLSVSDVSVDNSSTQVVSCEIDDNRTAVFVTLRTSGKFITESYASRFYFSISFPNYLGYCNSASEASVPACNSSGYIGFGSSRENWAISQDPNTGYLSEISANQQQTNNLLQQQNQQDQQDRDNLQGQQSSVYSSSDSSQQSAASTGTTLLAAFSGFVTALTSASPSNCNLDMDLGNLDLGVVDLCQLSLPQPFPTIASIMLILFCVPLSIATARKVINLFRSFQG